MFYEDEFESAWPLWQEGMNERRLVTVDVAVSIDRLLTELFQTGSDFQKRANETRRYRQVEETNWTLHFSDLPTSSQFQWTHAPLPLVEKTPSVGMMRKVLFTCPGNSMHPASFRTEQVERCMEYISGHRFVVDVCVLSSPIYCDRFRPIVRFTAERRASEHVHLTVDAQLIFVTKVNFVLKRFIESSARSGMDDSFKKWLEALEQTFPSALPNNSSKTQRHTHKRPKSRKDIKSHRLLDVPAEIEDEEDNETIRQQRSETDSLALAVLILSLSLSLLRFVCLLLSLPQRMVTVAHGWMTRIPWSIALQGCCVVLLTATVYPRLSPFLPFFNEAHCHSSNDFVLCFAISFLMTIFMRRVLGSHESKRVIFD